MNLSCWVYIIYTKRWFLNLKTLSKNFEITTKRLWKIQDKGIYKPEMVKHDPVNGSKFDTQI